MTINGNKISIKFKDIGGGLVTNDSKSPTSFAIAGSDKKWYWATTAEIQGDIINVTCTNVSAPKYVRYAYTSNPVTNLYNKEGLPAVPFTTEGNQLPVAINSQPAISYNVKNINSANSGLIYSVNTLGQVLNVSGVNGFTNTVSKKWATQTESDTIKKKWELVIGSPLKVHAPYIHAP